jgi:hypothetical protein
MTRDHFDISVKCLLSIYNTDSQSVNRDYIINSKWSNKSNIDEVLLFLIRIDLIELGKNDTYIISSKAVSLIESGEIGDYIWRYIDIEEYVYYQDIRNNIQSNDDERNKVAETAGNKTISVLYKSSFLVVITLLIPWIYINIKSYDNSHNIKYKKSRATLIDNSEEDSANVITRRDTIIVSNTPLP